MNTTIVLHGTLQPDGTLLFDEKPQLPPGRVRVMLSYENGSSREGPFFQMLQEIWAAREALGLKPRPTEEVEAERQALREGMEKELQASSRLQEESQQAP